MKNTAHAFNEENIKYLRGILGDYKVDTFLRFEATTENTTSEDEETYKRVKKCLEQMERFGNNHWWTSKDKKVLGYYQLMNPILLVPFDKFHEALEFLLDRPVWTHEMVLTMKDLRQKLKELSTAHRIQMNRRQNQSRNLLSS